MSDDQIRILLEERYDAIKNHLETIGADVKELSVVTNSHTTAIKILETNYNSYQKSIESIENKLDKESFFSKHGHKIFVVAITLIGMIVTYTTWKHDQTMQDKIQNEQLLELKALITEGKSK